MADENTVTLGVRTEGAPQAAAEIKSVEDGLKQVKDGIEQIRNQGDPLSTQLAGLKTLKSALESAKIDLKAYGTEGKEAYQVASLGARAAGQAIKEVAAEAKAARIDTREFSTGMGLLGSVLRTIAPFAGDASKELRILGTVASSAGTGARQASTLFSQLGTSAKAATEGVSALAGASTAAEAGTAALGEGAVAAEVGAGSLAATLSAVLAVAAAVAGEALIVLRANSDTTKEGLDGVKESAKHTGEELDKSVGDAADAARAQLITLGNELININVAFVKAAEGKTEWAEFDETVKKFVDTFLHGATAAQQFSDKLPEVAERTKATAKALGEAATAGDAFVNKALKPVANATNGTTLELSALNAKLKELGPVTDANRVEQLDLAAAMEKALGRTEGLTKAEFAAYEEKIKAIRASADYKKQLDEEAEARKKATAEAEKADKEDEKNFLSYAKKIDAVKKEIAAIEEHKKKIAEDAAAEKELAAVKAEAAATIAEETSYQSDINAQIAEQAKLVGELTEAYGPNDAAVTAAKDKQADLEAHVFNSNQKIREAQESVKDYGEEHNKTTGKIDDLNKKEDELKTKLGELMKQQADAAVAMLTSESSTERAATAAKHHADNVAAAAKAIADAAGAMPSLVSGLNQGTTAANSFADAMLRAVAASNALAASGGGGVSISTDPLTPSTVAGPSNTFEQG